MNVTDYKSRRPVPPGIGRLVEEAAFDLEGWTGFQTGRNWVRRKTNVSRKQKILETVHGAAVQEDPEGKEGWEQAITAQRPQPEGRGARGHLGATAVVQARREGEEKSLGRKGGSRNIR